MKKAVKPKPEVHKDHIAHRLDEFKPLNPLVEINNGVVEREYAKRLAKVQNALSLFCKKHDPHGLLSDSHIIRQIDEMSVKDDFAPFVLPSEFIGDLKATVKFKPEELLGPIPVPCTSTSAEVAAGLVEKNIPKNPLTRLALFGNSRDVAKLAEISLRLGIAENLDATHAVAIQLFCFKNSLEVEKKLVNLLLMSPLTDEALGKAMWIYKKALNKGETPYFTYKNIEETGKIGFVER